MGTVNSTDEARTAYNSSVSMGYSSLLETVPTYGSLTTAINHMNNNGGGILFFLGHGSSDMITWPGTGFGRNSSFASNDIIHAIQDFKLNKIDLVLFMGCETTSNVNTNLPKTAYNGGKGVKRTCGWDKKIFDVDTGTWVKRFYTKIATGASFLQSLNYANNYNYMHNSNMKSIHYWGKYGTGIKNAKELLNDRSLSALIGDVVEDESLAYTIGNNIEPNRQNLGLYIKASFDEKFNINDYEYEKTYDEIQDLTIHDYNLLINGAKTNLGYTIFEQNGKVTIYNHMEDYEKDNAIKTNNLKTQNKNINKQELIEKALSEIKLEKNESAFFDSTERNFDVKENKEYLTVNILVMNNDYNTKMIISRSFEI